MAFTHIQKTSGAAATALDTKDFDFIVVNASGACTVYLPTAAQNAGARKAIKRTGAGTVTVSPMAGDSAQIDGSATFSLSLANKFVEVISDGSNWWIIGSN
jgi:hypothetical protein